MTGKQHDWSNSIIQEYDDVINTWKIPVEFSKSKIYNELDIYIIFHKNEIFIWINGLNKLHQISWLTGRIHPNVKRDLFIWSRISDFDQDLSS